MCGTLAVSPSRACHTDDFGHVPLRLVYLAERDTRCPCLRKSSTSDQIGLPRCRPYLVPELARDPVLAKKFGNNWRIHLSHCHCSCRNLVRFGPLQPHSEDEVFTLGSLSRSSDEDIEAKLQPPILVASSRTGRARMIDHKLTMAYVAAVSQKALKRSLRHL